MAENGDIELLITLDDGSVVKGLISAENAAKKSGDKIEDSLSKNLGNAFKGAAKAASLGLAAAGAVVTATFIKGIAAASEQEDAINDLNNALARSGQYSKAASEDFQSFVAGLQATTTFGDEVILKNAAVLQSLGSLSNEGLKDATKAALDLSSALNIDLASATTLVGKAATGEIGSFSRFGLTIKKGSTDAETFANALAQINKQFGGAAAAKANTFSGALIQMQNAFGDLLEEIGMLITKSPAITAIFKTISPLITKISNEIIGFRKSGGFENLIVDAIKFGQAIVSYVIKPLEVIGNVVNTARLVISTGIQTIITFATDLINKFVKNVNSLLGLFGADINGIAEITDIAAQSTKETLIGLANETGTSFKNIMNTSGSEAANSFLTNMQRIAEEAPAIVDDMRNKVAEKAKDIPLSISTLGSAISNGFKAAETSVESLSSSIQGKLGSGIGAGFAALGGALAKGENAIGAFGKTMLGVMGDIAIQIGTILIAAGLGWSFIPGFQASSAAIPQGIALTVIGGALKAFAGGVGGSGASTSTTASGGGGVTDTTINGDVTPDTAVAQEIADQGPQISVTVQGNILDRRETGLELAEVIREAFDGNAVVFT